MSYYPRPGEDMSKAEVIAPRLEELLRLEGEPTAGKPIEHLHFEGLSFQYTDWTMPRAGPVDGQAAAFLKTAAIFAQRGAELHLPAMRRSPGPAATACGWNGA